MLPSAPDCLWSPSRYGPRPGRCPSLGTSSTSRWSCRLSATVSLGRAPETREHMDTMTERTTVDVSYKDDDNRVALWSVGARVSACDGVREGERGERGGEGEQEERERGRGTGRVRGEEGERCRGTGKGERQRGREGDGEG